MLLLPNISFGKQNDKVDGIDHILLYIKFSHLSMYDFTVKLHFTVVDADQFRKY